jgi:hypothetical protein
MPCIVTMANGKWQMAKDVRWPFAVGRWPQEAKRPTADYADEGGFPQKFSLPF